ncbi:glycosyltransferase [bacterium]|nr:glycosyltransferase [bacterium]
MTPKNQKITIVMPFQNTEKYLEECIESILAQSYENFELLAVDDHSLDNSYQIVSDFAIKDPRVKVFKNPERGILTGLRYLYSQKTGHYITRMDSDDIMPKNKLLELKQILDQSQSPTVATGFVKYFCQENQITPGFVRYEKWLNQMSKNSSHYDNIYTECPVASPCWMMFCDDYEKIGDYKVQTYPEDYDLFYRWYEAGFKIQASQNILHLWRDHQSRASRNDPNYLDQCFFPLKVKYLQKFQDLKNSDLVVWGAGPKGKKLVKELQKQGFQPQWVCQNPKKIGQNIYDIELRSIDYLSELKKPIVLLAVSQQNALFEIHQQLDQLQLKSNKDFFNFII